MRQCKLQLLEIWLNATAGYIESRAWTARGLVRGSGDHCRKKWLQSELSLTVYGADPPTELCDSDAID